MHRFSIKLNNKVASLSFIYYNYMCKKICNGDELNLMENKNHKKIQGVFEGERALFMQKNAYIFDSTFQNGESPLKHSKNINVEKTNFLWKYPIWYSKNVNVNSCYFSNEARAGIWYTDNITLTDCTFDAPKLFRRCNGVTIHNSTFTNAQETFWHCKNITLKDVVSNENYFGMNSKNVTIDNFTLNGNYPFDGGENIKITNSILNSKDAFWNTKNVIIENSKIKGEYFGWNSKNVTLINCEIASLQGFCFIDNLVMIDCKLNDTTLAFEYSSCNCSIIGTVGSIKNPSSGTITCDGVDELILEPSKIDPKATKIIIRK